MNAVAAVCQEASGPGTATAVAGIVNADWVTYGSLLIVVGVLAPALEEVSDNRIASVMRLKHLVSSSIFITTNCAIVTFLFVHSNRHLHVLVLKRKE